MKVLVLGAGYAGLAVARRLERSLPEDADLVVVNDSPDHLIRHEVHRAIRRPGLEDDLTVPLDSVLDRAELRVERVTGIDPGANRVELDSGSIDYDYCAVCLGAETAFYGLSGVAEHATPFRDLDHARRVRAEFLDLPEEGRIVVGGAGLTGVQVAGELAELADEEGADDVEVVLVEQLDDVAPGFPREFRSAVRDALEARGVDVRAGIAVRGADAERVDLDSGSIDYDAFVWTGGIRGPSALSGERPEVRPSLRIGGGTFVVGDAARVIDRDGEPVMASAQAALAEARVAARNIERLVEAERGDAAFDPRLEALGFDARGWIVSVGDGAVAQVGPAVLTGRAATALKTTVGVGYLASVGAVREAVERVTEEFR